MSKTDEIRTISTNTEQQLKQQQLSNAKDHDYYVAHGQKLYINMYYSNIF